MNEPLTCDHCGYTGEDVVARTYNGHSLSHCTNVVVCTQRSEIASKFRKGR
jgi:hypothetical protein